MGAPRRDWTVLYVLNGDNDLREAATLDLVELDREGAPENVNVVAQLYRGDLAWSKNNLSRKLKTLFKPEPKPAVASDWRGVKTYEVRHQGEATRTLPYQNEGSPSDPESLRSFVSWAMKRFPAEHYAVVVSGHGGPDGTLSDARGKRMPFEALAQALQEGAREAGESVDVLLLDSCSTASEQTADALKGAADFLVASPEKVPYRGWSEKATMDFLKQHPQATPREFAESLLAPEHRINQAVLYVYERSSCP